MKLLVLSDLHIDTSDYNYQAVQEIADHFADDPPAVMVVLGDVATFDTSLTEKALCQLGTIKCKRLFVPGNHDAWIRPHAYHGCLISASAPDSFDKLNQVADICHKNGWKYLMDGPMIVDDIGFAGTMGWYDYSLGLKDKKSLEDYKAYNNGFVEWCDGRYVFFRNGSSRDRMPDPAVADRFNKQLDIDLLKLDGCKKVVACTHMVPFRELQDTEPPDFCDGYGGSALTGKILVEHKVDISLSGHLHRRLHKMIRGIDCYQSAIGYLAQDGYFPSPYEPLVKFLFDEKRVLLLDI